MILADTSVWIELLNGQLGKSVTPDDLLRLATCAPVLQEVLQGLRDDRRSDEFRDALLALPCLGDPLSVATCLHAADLYRQARKIGYTIRSSVDCLIAAIAIEHRATVWHRDRDFRTIARFTSLSAVERLPRTTG